MFVPIEKTLILSSATSFTTYSPEAVAPRDSLGALFQRALVT